MTTTTKRLRTGILAIGTAALMLALAGCGGGSNDNGEYIGATSGPLGVVKIDGDTVTFTSLECPGKSNYTSDTSVGQLNKDRTQITWTQPGKYHGSDPITINDDSVKVGDRDFVARNGSQGKTMYDEGMKTCGS
jgi:hypothetical protein